MLFGEFLVENKHISNEQLAETLVEQIKSTPSIEETLYDLKLISEIQFLEALKLARNEHILFVESVKKLGFWQSEFEQKISDYVKRFRKPLGEILVKNGLMDVKQLSAVLGDYLQEFAKKDSNSGNNGSGNADTITHDSMSQSSQEGKAESTKISESSKNSENENNNQSVEIKNVVAIEDLKKFESSVPTEEKVCGLSLFEKGKVNFNELDSALALMEMDGSNIEEILDKAVFDAFHWLRGYSLINDIDLLDKVLFQFEALVESNREVALAKGISPVSTYASEGRKIIEILTPFFTEANFKTDLDESVRKAICDCDDLGKLLRGLQNCLEKKEEVS